MTATTFFMHVLDSCFSLLVSRSDAPLSFLLISFFLYVLHVAFSICLSRTFPMALHLALLDTGRSSSSDFLFVAPGYLLRHLPSSSNSVIGTA